MLDGSAREVVSCWSDEVVVSSSVSFSSSFDITTFSPLKTRGDTSEEGVDSAGKGDSSSPPKMMRLGGEEYCTMEVGLSSRIMLVSCASHPSTSFCDAAHAYHVRCDAVVENTRQKGRIDEVPTMHS